jgi:hypothetical protein
VGDAAANPDLTESCRPVAAVGDSLERDHKAVNSSSHLRPVEAISETTTGRHAQDRFLFTATVELFEQYGFARRTAGRQACLDRQPRRARSITNLPQTEAQPEGTSRTGQQRRTPRAAQGATRQIMRIWSGLETRSLGSPVAVRRSSAQHQGRLWGLTLGAPSEM